MGDFNIKKSIYNKYLQDYKKQRNRKILAQTLNVLILLLGMVFYAISFQTLGNAFILLGVIMFIYLFGTGLRAAHNDRLRGESIDFTFQKWSVKFYDLNKGIRDNKNNLNEMIVVQLDARYQSVMKKIMEEY